MLIYIENSGLKLSFTLKNSIAVKNLKSFLKLNCHIISVIMHAGTGKRRCRIVAVQLRFIFESWKYIYNSITFCFLFHKNNLELSAQFQCVTQ